jgi:hypothetical protein
LASSSFIRDSDSKAGAQASSMDNLPSSVHTRC